ncbi:MAG: LytR family transcriptional regulator [Marmoricola sp.]|nr:LytR family transcriptional regulator [Marmoricola sp.]
MTDRRQLVTAITLAGAFVVIVVMGLWGLHAARAPIAKDPSTHTGSSGPTCSPQDQTVVKYVTRSQVTVSVYNSGLRSGRAGATVNLLERAGFKPGAIGNAPASIKVPRAEVRTTQTDDPRALLVAQAFGPHTKVVVDDNDYGPGIDVFIGDKFHRLAPGAPKRERLTNPVVTCK